MNFTVNTLNYMSHRITSQVTDQKILLSLKQNILRFKKQIFNEASRAMWDKEIL